MPRDQRIEPFGLRKQRARLVARGKQALRALTAPLRPTLRVGAVRLDELNKPGERHHWLHRSDSRTEPSALRSARRARTSKVSTPETDVPSAAAVSAFDMPS